MAGRARFLTYFRNYHSNSIFFRNLALILLLVAVPLVMLSMFTFRYNRNILEEEISKANTRSLVKFQGSMDIIQNEIERIAAQMVYSADAVRFFNSDLEEYPDFLQIENLRSIMQDMDLVIHNYIHAIYLFSERNDYLLTQLGGGSLSKWSNQSAYSRMRTPVLGWHLDYQSGSGSNTDGIVDRFLTYYEEAHAADGGKRIGTAAILLSVSKVRSFLFGPDAPSDEILFIVDEKGTVLFSTEFDWIGQPSEELFRYQGNEFFTDQSEVSIGTNDKNSYIFSYLYSEINDWIYCSVLSREDFFYKQTALRRIMVISLVFSLTVSAGAAFFISLYVFKPIHEVISMLENPRNIDDYQEYDNELKFIAGNIVHNYVEYEHNREEIEKRVAMLNAARVRALQAQINPHFLNNTLQLVNWTILRETKNEDSEAIAILEQLADLVRVNMETRSNLTSLADEVQYVSKYMAIQKMRYGDRIRFDLSVPKELESIPVLKMLLQPVVENAIYHGLKKNDGAGTIYVGAKRSDDYLLLEISDDGIGMDIGEMEKLNEHLRTIDSLADNHIGLLNVSLRLRLVFGQQAKIQLSSRAGGGIKVTVSIPAR